MHLNQQQKQYDYDDQSLHMERTRSNRTSSNTSVNEDFADLGIFSGGLHQPSNRGYDFGDVLCGLEHDDYKDNGNTASRRGSYTMNDEIMGSGSVSKRTSYTMSEDSGDRISRSRRPSYSMSVHPLHPSHMIEAQSHLEGDFPGYESHVRGLSPYNNNT